MVEGHLVLSRRRDEQIVVGDESVVITVVEIRTDKVRLGIKAPKAVPIHRREVFSKIKRAGDSTIRCECSASRPEVRCDSCQRIMFGDAVSVGAA